jgi:hypothetical protein
MWKRPRPRNKQTNQFHTRRERIVNFLVFFFGPHFLCVCVGVFASDRHTNIRFRPMVDKSDQQCKSTRVYK